MARALLIVALAALVGCGSDAGAGAVAQSSPCGISAAESRPSPGIEGRSVPLVPEAGPALPRLSGRVVDQADLLAPAAEAAVTRQLAALEARTRDQLVVVTTPDLHGEPIEEFGLRLGDRWGIGQRDLDNGVLLIVAPNERKTRIEVGCGLERLLTDTKATEIIDQSLLPRFRDSDFQTGITAGVDAIIRVLESDTRRPQTVPRRKDA